MINSYSQILGGIGLSIIALFVVIGSPTVTKAASSIIDQEQVIVDYTNQIRGQAGLPDLEIDSRLMVSAFNKASDMAEKGYFSHANPEGLRMAYWINDTGYYYSLAGENLAKGFTSIDRLMQAWLDSPSHYRNLVETEFTNIGIGISVRSIDGRDIIFVAQHFGKEKETIVSNITVASSDIAKAASLEISPSLAMEFVPLINLGQTSDQDTILSLAELKIEDISSDRDKPGNWLLALLAIASLGIIGYTLDSISIEKMRNYIYSKKSKKKIICSHWNYLYKIDNISDI